VIVTKLGGRNEAGNPTNDRGPIALSWRLNAALSEERALNDSLESQETELESRQQRDRRQVEAAQEEFDRVDALNSVGRASKDDLKRAKDALEVAKSERKTTDGKLLLVRRDLADVRERLPKRLRDAQGQSRAALRSEAVAQITTIARGLIEVAIANERLCAIGVAADVAFPWASREAQEFGHAVTPLESLARTGAAPRWRAPSTVVRRSVSSRLANRAYASTQRRAQAAREALRVS
jgi:hypothetical protein